MRPLRAERKFGIGRNRRPSAAYRNIAIAQRGLPDPLRGAFVVGRLMRERECRGGTRFGGGCRRCRLGRGRVNSGTGGRRRCWCRVGCRSRRASSLSQRGCGRKHRGNGNDRDGSHVACPRGCAAMAPTVNRKTRIGEPDPQFHGFGILARDRCVLIKLSMRLLHCRKSRWRRLDLCPLC